MLSSCDDCGVRDWIPITAEMAISQLPPDPTGSKLLILGLVDPFACRRCGMIGMSVVNIEAVEAFVGKYPGGYAAAGRRRIKSRAKK